MRRDEIFRSQESENLPETGRAVPLVPLCEPLQCASVAQVSVEEEFVDLGLSVRWARCNLGANRPEEYGHYYAWGETGIKDNYTEEESLTAGMPLRSISGNPRWDAAAEVMGQGVRMPTEKDFEELMDNCTLEWTVQNGKHGLLVTSDINGNRIFLPAAGRREGTERCIEEEFGCYWSADPYEKNRVFAYGFCFSRTGFLWEWDFRYRGHVVRPVQDL